LAKAPLMGSLLDLIPNIICHPLVFVIAKIQILFQINKNNNQKNNYFYFIQSILLEDIPIVNFPAMAMT
jgi:hypothetical protein